MVFTNSGLKRKKISAPLRSLNVEALTRMTPDSSEMRSTSDNVEDIDASTSIFDSPSKKPLPVHQGPHEKASGRPITQIFESFNKTRSNVENSDFSDLFKGAPTDSVTSLIDDIRKPKTGEMLTYTTDTDKSGASVKRRLAPNRFRVTEAYKTPVKSPHAAPSNVWKMLEDEAVTSTTKKSSAIKKTIKFSRRNNKAQKATQMRQSTLGVPSTKSTLKRKRDTVKSKRQVQSKITSKGPQAEGDAATVGKPEGGTLQVNEVRMPVVEIPQSDSLERCESQEVILSAKAKERSSSPIIKGEQILVESTPLSQEPEEIEYNSNRNPPAEALHETSPPIEIDSIKPKQTEERTATQIKKVSAKQKCGESTIQMLRRTPQKQKVGVRVNESVSESNVDSKSVIVSRAIKIQEERLFTNGSTPGDDAIVSTVTKKSQEERPRDFHEQLYEGLNLISLNLVNRMKLIEAEIAKKEQKMRDELEAKFKDLEHFQTTTRDRFGEYVDQLIMQMTSSENDLKNWIERNS